MINTSEFIKDELLNLIQPSNFAGWIYAIDYEQALIITNDKWKSDVKGIPHNSFLLATAFDPLDYGNSNEIDREVILLRVTGVCRLPQDDDMIKTKIDTYQNKTGVNIQNEVEFDNITRNKLQFGGLECRVLGTFFMKDNTLQLGSDIESFSASLQTRVYMPTGTSLEKIVNFVDPIRKNKSAEDFKLLGIQGNVEPFPIGTVRYTSTDRTHRATKNDHVKFSIQPADFLARRTAVLGMTRTGKSNMIKQTVSVVKNVSTQNSLKIGQLIFDINGEYANANSQDNGSIASIFQTDCVSYRMIPSPGFRPLLNNFYEELEEGHLLICDTLPPDSSNDLKVFKTISLYKPDPSERSLINRWNVKVALYKALLKKAGFEAQPSEKVSFKASQEIMKKVDPSVDPQKGLSLSDAIHWFENAYTAHSTSPLQSSSSTKSNPKNWFDDECLSMLYLLVGKNERGTPIQGYRAFFEAKKYHSSERNSDVSKEIYDFLLNGKIVILDLSVGNAILREKLSQKIAAYIFNSSMNTFTQGETPSNIIVYIEEAHNLIGKSMQLTDTWPRLAKEGAKYKIALVYATQEVSSVHKNILANTENWFVSHLNNDLEIKELSHFYDFSDFSKSLLRSQDVGFTRVKTLSSPYVVPVQIDKFDPANFIHT